MELYCRDIPKSRNGERLLIDRFLSLVGEIGHDFILEISRVISNCSGERKGSFVISMSAARLDIVISTSVSRRSRSKVDGVIHSSLHPIALLLPSSNPTISTPCMHLLFSSYRPSSYYSNQRKHSKQSELAFEEVKFAYRDIDLSTLFLFMLVLFSEQPDLVFLL